MLTSGDVVELDLGLPEGREAAFQRPTIVVTAQRILDADPEIVHVVPLTANVRGWASELTIEPDRTNGLVQPSAAQCQHVRSVSVKRVGEVRGNVGPASLTEVRELIGLILDIG